VIVSKEQHEAALEELAKEIADPRAGILGPRSVAWRLGGSLDVFLGGGRAAFLQLAHPMVAHAIDRHSKTRTDVVGRFQRTFRHVFAMVFGELDDALVAARRVHAIHTRIHGEVPGSSSTTLRYHANDAAALRWVHATLVDTTLVVRELLDGTVAASDRDRYIVEMNRFARLFGIPHELLPSDHAEHAAYMRATLPTLEVAPCAVEMGRFLVGRGGPGRQPPLGRISEALTAALLPGPLAEAFGLRGSPTLVRAALAILRRPLRLLPTLPAHAEARRRLSGKPPGVLDAWTERWLFGLARSATGSR